MRAISAGFFSELFQKTRMEETPFTEHRTAQSVWPGLANSPRMTLRGFFVYGVCGIVQPRRWSSRMTLRGSSRNADGGAAQSPAQLHRSGGPGWRKIGR